MPAARLALLLAPQAGVVVSYVRFHETVFSTVSTAAESMAVGLLLDTLIVVILVLLVLAVNALVAMALLGTAIRLDASGRATRQPTAPWRARRSPPRAGSRGRRRASVADSSTPRTTDVPHEAWPSRRA